MTGRLEGKVCIITGAAQGMGEYFGADFRNKTCHADNEKVG